MECLLGGGVGEGGGGLGRWLYASPSVGVSVGEGEGGLGPRGRFGEAGFVGLVSGLFGEVGRFWLFLAEDVVLLFEYFEDMRLPVPQIVVGSLIIQTEPLIFFPHLALSSLICAAAELGTPRIGSALR